MAYYCCIKNSIEDIPLGSKWASENFQDDAKVDQIIMVVTTCFSCMVIQLPNRDLVFSKACPVVFPSNSLKMSVWFAINLEKIIC